MEIFLGSAQFGSDYGITNTKGKIHKKEAFKILDYARANGIDSIDTAYSYGESEKILGEYGISDFKVSTKLPSLINETSIHKDSIKGLFYESLRRMKIERIDNLFLHDSLDLLNVNRNEVLAALTELKEEGLVNKLGVSIYDPEEVIFISKVDSINLIQSPLNILDKRILESKYRKLMDSKDIKLQARSIFLQGILLQDLVNLHKYFSKYKEVFLAWEKYIEDRNFSKLEVCINYLRSLKNLDSIVVGVASLQELKQLISALKVKRFSVSFNFNPLATELIDPRKWKQE